MKKVKWRWDYGCYVPFCPYCNEYAYEKDHCMFCKKEYKWVDKSKARAVRVGEYTVVQTSSNNIYVCKGKRLVEHIFCAEKKSKRELKKFAGVFCKAVLEKGADNEQK